ncbi:MAG: UDP-N-acetylmuramoyl-tripeptide--D-alanyl-D-alanine ligase, partial [Solirubrobacteraceae bacterium]
MRHWTDQRIAGAAGGELVRGLGDRAGSGPARVVIDSRVVAPGDLFVAIPGERVDGGEFAAEALRAGAWGVLAEPPWAREAAATGEGVVIASEHPVAALGALARAWRQDLAAHVIAVTGSVGKTSTKDLIAALVAPHRTVAASRANFNTEIGLPLEVLAAPPGTEVLVLELAMRGFGQIAELTAICQPDVGVITNIGPVHLELVGSLAGVAKAKAELLEHVPIAIVPADVPELEPYLRPGLDVVRFGTDVFLEDFDAPHVRIVARELSVQLDVPFTARHQLVNLLAAVAAAQAAGVEPSGRVDVSFGALREERLELASGAVVINECYNANPLSMRAALDDLATQAPPGGRRVAVLGDMLELGPGEVE